MTVIINALSIYLVIINCQIIKFAIINGKFICIIIPCLNIIIIGVFTFLYERLYIGFSFRVKNIFTKHYDLIMMLSKFSLLLCIIVISLI